MHGLVHDGEAPCLSEKLQLLQPSALPDVLQPVLVQKAQLAGLEASSPGGEDHLQELRAVPGCQLLLKLLLHHSRGGALQPMAAMQWVGTVIAEAPSAALQEIRAEVPAWKVLLGRC